MIPMFRNHLGRLALLSTILFTSGCSLCRSSSCCDEKPGLFSRCRLSSNSQPVVISSGQCCDTAIAGPMLPGSAPGYVLPAPQQNIPRIDENGKQMPWDPKTSRPGTKTGNEVRTPKEGT